MNLKKVSMVSDKDVCFPQICSFSTVKKLCEPYKDTQELYIAGHNVKNLSYADDTILMQKIKKKTCNNYYTLLQKERIGLAQQKIKSNGLQPKQ